MKILHIHTDFKFLYVSENFNSSDIQNDLLFIGDAQGDERVKFQFSSNRPDLDEIVKLADTYDAVVLLDLDQPKSYIANRLREDISIFWLFFGYELYGKLLYRILGTQTIKLLNKGGIKNRLKNSSSPFFRLYSKWKLKEFYQAVKRINYFLCLCQEEYVLLSRYFKLPKFAQRPYVIDSPLDYTGNKIGNKMMIGNSRAVFNNHLEVLDLLEDFPEVEKYAFLSYGQEKAYYRAVMEKGAALENFKPITTFLPKAEFEEIYKNLDAFVLNSYRQMAVGNIFTAIRYGVKIYMNEKNAYYHFLIREGFKIGTLQTLKQDLQNNNLSLTKEQAIYNGNKLRQLTEKYSKDEFLSNVKQAVKNRK